MFCRWRFNLVYCLLFSKASRAKVARETSKWASIVIVICCNDLYDTGLIIYHTGTNCNVNYAPIITSIELPESASCISGLDNNEEQDVGHEFKQPVVCWPASWQCNEYLGDEDTHTHPHSLWCCVTADSAILFIMQSDNAVRRISHRRGACFMFLQRLSVFMLMSFSLSLHRGWPQDWLQYAIQQASYSCISSSCLVST